MKVGTQKRKFCEIGMEYAGIDEKIQIHMKEIENLKKRKEILESSVRQFLQDKGPVEYLGTVFYLDESGAVRTMECKSAYDEMMDFDVDMDFGKTD